MNFFISILCKNEVAIVIVREQTFEKRITNLKRYAGNSKPLSGKMRNGRMNFPAVNQHNVLRSHILNAAIDKKTRGTFKSYIKLQFRMPMTFDNFTSRTGMADKGSVPNFV